MDTCASQGKWLHGTPHRVSRIACAAAGPPASRAAAPSAHVRGRGSSLAAHSAHPRPRSRWSAGRACSSRAAATATSAYGSLLLRSPTAPAKIFFPSALLASSCLLHHYVAGGHGLPTRKWTDPCALVLCLVRRAVSPFRHLGIAALQHYSRSSWIQPCCSADEIASVGTLTTVIVPLAVCLWLVCTRVCSSVALAASVPGN